MSPMKICQYAASILKDASEKGMAVHKPVRSHLQHADFAVVFWRPAASSRARCTDDESGRME